MKFKYSNLGLALLVLVVIPFARAAEVVDRIVATVNGHIILQSDWQDALHYEALVDNRPVDQLSVDEQKSALDHLIDQELLREQMQSSDFRHATDDQIAQQISDIRKQYPGAETDAGWQAVLQRYGLNPDSLHRHVNRQLDVMSLVDTRLRPGVTIDSKTIESYYNQQILPQLRQSGSHDVPLAEVSPKIKELLTQQKVNQLLVAWLQNLRSGSEIRKEPLDSRGSLQ